MILQFDSFNSLFHGRKVSKDQYYKTLQVFGSDS